MAATTDAALVRAGDRTTGIAFIVASALSFGAMAILARVAYADGVDTTTLLALRFAIAFVCLALIAHVRRVGMPRGRDLASNIVLGGAGYGLQATSFFIALTMAPAGLVALLLYLHPALVAILAAVLLRERMTAVKIGALAVALCGMVLTVAPALRADAGIASQLGIALGIAAAAIYAVYIVVGMRLTARIAPLAMATVVAGSAAAVFAIATAIQGPQFPQSSAGWLAIAAIALVSTVAAITLFFAGLARIGPTQASTLSTIEPVFTVVLAAFLLGERIEIVQAIGGALILAAVVMLARATQDRPIAAAQ